MKMPRTLKAIALMSWVVCASQVSAQSTSVGAAEILPSTETVVRALGESPAYQAALLTVEAEQSISRQYRVGPYEWIGTATAGRRNQATPTSERTQEWEVGIERTLRWPGKAAVSSNAGDARVERARAELRKVWRDQARLLLDRYGTWLRERETARVWLIQTRFLQQQLNAVSRRRRLGDAARIEQQQASAALAVADAQAQTAAGRALAAREALDRQFPGLALPSIKTVMLPAAVQSVDAAQNNGSWARSPEVELSRRVAEVATTQLRLEIANQRPDPTVGVRVGRARSGSEQTVGVLLSIPFGGEYRAAAVAAATSRAAEAAQLQADVERLAQVAANQRAREAQTAYDSWKRNVDAARQLVAAADSLARGYTLGEGSLGEVLTARRLANEQQLSASLALVEVWVTRSRLNLEDGSLWAEPGDR